MIRIVTWNLFHGRDFPPNPRLRTWRSRLTRRPERDATHLQLNRDLRDEFAGVLAGWSWDVALLQECPPRWSGALASACGAEAQRVLTSRNWFLPITSAIGRRNPDLIASWEGGSNLTLVRDGEIVETHSFVVSHRPERRVLGFARVSTGVCVANLHADGRGSGGEDEVRAGARQAVEWAAGAPLVFGGDMNLRPETSPVFAELERDLGLRPAAPGSIDHLLARGLEVADAPQAAPADAREVTVDGFAVRLSDHAPVFAEFSGPSIRLRRDIDAGESEVAQ